MGAYYQFLGAYYQFLGACFYWGNIIIFTLTVWGQGFIGGDYHYLGARLLATSFLPPDGQAEGNFA